jgi:hypothetical protein
MTILLNGMIVIYLIQFYPQHRYKQDETNPQGQKKQSQQPEANRSINVKKKKRSYGMVWT